MERSAVWRREYTNARVLHGANHRGAVSDADTYFARRRRKQGKPQLRTPWQAIQSKGDRRGRVLDRYKSMTDDEVRAVLEGAGNTKPTDVDAPPSAPVSAGSVAVAETQAKLEESRARMRRRGLGGRGDLIRRILDPDVTRAASIGRRGMGDEIRRVAAERQVDEATVIAEATAAVEALTTSDDPEVAAIELALAAETLDDDATAAAAEVAAELMQSAATRSAAPSSDVPSDLDVAAFLDVLEDSPRHTTRPTPCTDCAPQHGAAMADLTRVRNPAVRQILGERGAPAHRMGNPKLATALPLLDGAAIAAGVTTTFPISPVSDIEKGAVLFISFTGSTIPPTVTGLSVSGQNQIFGATGVGVAQPFLDIANLQAPGLFIPLKIPANNSFQLTVRNNDGVNPIAVDAVVIGTAVQLSQQLAACGLGG
ncbi:MAG: hypothetical protein RI826_10005 [Chlorobium phaeovibrioides]|nr:hypothetical protein [Chlorobium phaeovibrioides]